MAAGRGRAAKLISDAEELAQLIGWDPYPGSLNLILERPVLFDVRSGRQFDLGARAVWPATVEGLDVWVYRWSGARMHVIELIAAVNLRDSLDLGEGARVRVDMSRTVVVPASLAKRVAWALFWFGRRSWYYDRDGYQRRIKRLESRLGLLQLVSGG